MENLPPINEMYASIQQQRDYGVIKKYQHTRNQPELKKSPTKKGSYLNDTIKMSCSPGPANASNIQLQWVRPNKQLIKYSDRKTYIDEIQLHAKKRNSPSSNHYKIELQWPEKENKTTHVCQKTNFLDNSQFESDEIPGPGAYLVATHIGKIGKQYHYTQNKPLQPRKQISADMNTYNPLPVSYSTFQKYEKMSKNKSKIQKKQELTNNKKNQNLIPGPGHYQMIHTWQAKQKKMPKGSLSYLNKITKRPTPNIYYN